MRHLVFATAGLLAALPPAFAEERAAEAPAASIELMQFDTTVAADGSFIQTRHAALKATNEAGALQIARINLPFAAGMQTIEVLEAYTLKPDGRKIPVDPATIFEQLPQDAAQRGMVTDQRVKVLFFPQFSSGDKAVYTVKITNAHPYFPGEFFTGDVFPGTISYKEVSETITAPKSLGLKVESHNVAFTQKDAGDKIIYNWHYSAPVPQKPSTALVSPLDREARFYVSSFKDYAELGRAYATLAAPKIEVTPKVKALAAEITGNETDRKQQARKIYEWVVHNIRYVAIELGQGSFVPHDVDTIVANGYGDCKDHDAILQALLKAKGIVAESLLINSSNDYSLTEAPSFAQLDHVITAVPEFGLYLDASMPVAPFGVLPLAEYGKPAVRATVKTAGLTTIPAAKPGAASMHTTTVQKIDADGVLTGTTTTSATGIFSLDLRLIGYGIQALGAEKAAEMQMASRGFKDGKGTLTMDPPTTLDQSYTVRGQYKVPGWKSVLTSDSNIMPGGLRVLALSGDGIMGPFYDDDSISQEATVCISGKAEEEISLELPQGYSFGAAPKDTTVKTANITFTSTWTLAGKVLTAHRSFSSTITEPLCRGAVRSETAAALKRIAKSYDSSFAIVADIPKQAAATADKSALNDLIDNGNALITKGQYDEAVVYFDRAVTLAPDDVRARLARGAAYLDSNHFAEALADFDKALALKPSSVDAYRNRGLVFNRQRQWDKAIAEANKALAIEPDNADVLVDRGTAYMANGQLPKALEDMNAAIKADPDNSRAYANRASLYNQKRDFRSASKDCEAALERDKKYIWALTTCSRVEASNGNVPRAIQYLDTALSADPNNEEAHFNRGWLLASSEAPERAEADFNAILTVHPDSWIGLMGRGEVLLAREKYPAALADFDRVIVQVPDHISAHAGRFEALIALHKTQQAKDECAQLKAANPRKAWPLIACSKIKRELGDDIGANAETMQAQALEPGFSRATETPNVFRRSKASQPPATRAYNEGLSQSQNGNHEAAARAFDKADKLGMDANSVLPRLCQSLAQTSQLADAAYQCSRALQAHEFNPDLLEARGAVYYRQGKFAAALEDFSQAAKTNGFVARYVYERGLAKLKTGDKKGGEADIAKAKTMKADVATTLPKPLIP